MLYVMLANAKETATRKACMERRLNFHFPDGVKIVGEFWLQTTKPQVITVIESDSPAAITDTTMQWDDLYDIEVVPAITADDGIAMAKHLVAKQGLLV